MSSACSFNTHGSSVTVEGIICAVFHNLDDVSWYQLHMRLEIMS